MILHLAKLNEFVEYFHFKMATLENAVKLVAPDCYMALIDLHDAYHQKLMIKSILNSLGVANCISLQLYLMAYLVDPENSQCFSNHHLHISKY